MWALGNLCVAAPCRDAAASCGAAEVVAAALRDQDAAVGGGGGGEEGWEVARRRAAEARTAALSALDALCRDHPGNQAAAAATGCVELAVGALRAHLDSPEVVVAGCNALTSAARRQPESQARRPSPGLRPCPPCLRRVAPFSRDSPA